MKFEVDAARCVACLACVRVCPTDAIAVIGEQPTLHVVESACIRCGHCVPACPHDAVTVHGQLEAALRVASSGAGVLILSPESAAHFYPATPEQVTNACYAAGFRVVTHGVFGDELVAGAYLRLWREENWGTLIRSSDPVVVATICAQYPELVPYLAPVTTPPVAEARYLRSLYGAETRVVYAGVHQPVDSPELDAVVTFDDLAALFATRGIEVAAQPTVFYRVPSERRRHLSTAGGMPLALLDEVRQNSARFRKVRGLAELPALARAIVVDRLDLGFVDLLSHDGALDHPLYGPKEELYWRRWLLANAAPPRSAEPVVDARQLVDVGATYDVLERPEQPDPEAVQAILDVIGLGPNGRPWDCQACGFQTCRRFAEAASMGRATLRQCGPYQERRADEAVQVAAVDGLTGLATYRVLQDRLGFEVERSKRSGEGFAVMFIDLDRFKYVNDRYGHEAGNVVLREVAREIVSSIRASDVAARYGGDEFVAILTRTDLLGAKRVAETVRRGIEAAGRRLGYHPGLITASIGLAAFDPGSPAEGDLLVTADRALYRAKAAGRNAVV